MIQTLIKFSGSVHGRVVDEDLKTFDKEFHELQDKKAKAIEEKALKESEKEINEQVILIFIKSMF